MLNLKRLIFLVMLGSITYANAQETQVGSKAAKQSTLIVNTKHQQNNGFFEKIGRPFRKGYKAVENAIVESYQAVEDGVGGAYKKIESSTVNFGNNVVEKSNKLRHK